MLYHPTLLELSLVPMTAVISKTQVALFYDMVPQKSLFKSQIYVTFRIKTHLVYPLLKKPRIKYVS